MIIELLTYWKTITELEKPVNVAAISKAVKIDWTDITSEDSDTFYYGDNLVVLRCYNVTPDQLKALKKSKDCFVLRENKVPRTKAKMKAWLTKRGITRSELQNAKFETDDDIKSMITKHKTRSREEKNKKNAT